MDNEIRHDTHGRASECGPDDCDCPCRATAKQGECAKGGCGFCQAASSGCNIALANYDEVEVRAVAEELRQRIQASLAKACARGPRHWWEDVDEVVRAIKSSLPPLPTFDVEIAHTNELRRSRDVVSWDPKFGFDKPAPPSLPMAAYPCPNCGLHPLAHAPDCPTRPPLIAVNNGRAHRCYLCDKPKLQFRSLRPLVCTECRP